MLVFLILCFEMPGFGDCFECDFVVIVFNDVAQAADDDVAKLRWDLPPLFNR